MRASDGHLTRQQLLLRRKGENPWKYRNVPTKQPGTYSRQSGQLDCPNSGGASSMASMGERFSVDGSFVLQGETGVAEGRLLTV